MKIKNFIIVILSLMVFTSVIFSKESASFLKNGTVKYESIIDMSSNTLKFEFNDGTKIHKKKIWMINFNNREWNFPKERKKLNLKFDTIVLNTNKIIYRKIIDFSSRQHIVEFENGSAVKIVKIKRIYFCCTKLPKAYKKQLDESGYSTVLADGRVLSKAIKYYNRMKTGFEDGLQINSKDILMINFENKEKDFPTENKYINPTLDTVLLKNGGIYQKQIATLDFKAKKIIFSDKNVIEMKNVLRIYLKKQKKLKNQKFKKLRDRKGIKKIIK